MIYNKLIIHKPIIYNKMSDTDNNVYSLSQLVYQLRAEIEELRAEIDYIKENTNCPGTGTTDYGDDDELQKVATCGYCFKRIKIGKDDKKLQTHNMKEIDE